MLPRPMDSMPLTDCGWLRVDAIPDPEDHSWLVRFFPPDDITAVHVARVHVIDAENAQGAVLRELAWLASELLLQRAAASSLNKVKEG